MVTLKSLSRLFVVLCVVTFALTVAVVMTSAKPSGVPAVDGDGLMAVSPATVTYGTSSATLVFTFTANADFGPGSQVEIDIPAGWTAPTTASGAGHVSWNTGTCTLNGNPPVAVTGMSIFIDLASCPTSAFFNITYANATPGPLSGSPVTVVQGNASIMIGGDEAAYEKIKPVLLAIGPKVTRIGGNGLACQMKIAVNLLLMVEVICFGEAVALAEKGGVARDVALDAMLKSVAASPVLGYRGPFILDGKMPKVPLADVTLQQKDMLLALNLGRTLGSPVPLAAAANEMMNACRGLGIDGNDFVVAHQVYRRLGGQS